MTKNAEDVKTGFKKWVILGFLILTVIVAAVYLLNYKEKETASKRGEDSITHESSTTFRGFDGTDNNSDAADGIGNLGGNIAGNMKVGEKDQGSSAMGGNEETDITDAYQAKADSVAEDIDGMDANKSSTYSYNVYFGFDIDTIPHSAVDELTKGIQAQIRQSSKIIIEGHASWVGTEEYNQDLSERRAEFISKVINKMCKQDKCHIQTIGYGENRPIDKRAYLNRRVEIKILPCRGSGIFPKSR